MMMPRPAEEIETSTGEEVIQMAEGKATYTGNISGAGAQFVKAPVQVKNSTGKGKVKTGDDLRNGGKGK